MNLGEMINRVQKELGDDAEVQITLEDIKAWINQGVLQVARLVGMVEDSLLDQPTDGRQVEGYPLPPEFIRITQVRCYVGSEMIAPTKVEFEQVARLPSPPPDYTGGPLHWYIWRRSLWFNPMPVADLTYSIFFTRVPVALVTDDAVPELPLTAHNDVLIYAKQRGLELQEEYENAGYYKSQFTEATTFSTDEKTTEGDPSYPAIGSIEDFEYN